MPTVPLVVAGGWGLDVNSLPHGFGAEGTRLGGLVSHEALASDYTGFSGAPIVPWGAGIVGCAFLFTLHLCPSPTRTHSLEGFIGCPPVGEATELILGLSRLSSCHIGQWALAEVTVKMHPSHICVCWWWAL